MARAGVSRRAQRAAGRRFQRGVALLGLLAVAVMVFAYVLTSRLNAASQFVGIDREHNAKVMALAKRALVGWMVMNAVGTDDDPGRLPCPEAPGFFGDPAQEGIAAGSCLPPNNVGRLPWRTLGLERLADHAGEPLWYAVSPGWSKQGSANSVINSDSAGQLTLNGTANDAVALVFAPGAVLSVQGGSGCTAWPQVRPAAGPPDVRNYLECGNEAGNHTSGSAAQSFNDQVLRVSAADLIPALEAAIQERMQREIAPAMRSVYTFLQYSGIPSSSPMYPYAAAFGDPGLSSFQGASGVYQGLLPVNSASSMVAYQSTPGSAVETLGDGYIESQSCGWEITNDVRTCQGYYKEDSSEPWRPIRIEMTARFTNVAMGLRTLDTARFQVDARDDDPSDPWLPVAASYQATMLTDGSLTVRFWGIVPNIDAMGWGTRAEFRLRIERAVIDDHPLVRPGDATFGWFVRNQWHRLIYYAVAQQNTAGSLSSFGCGSSNCLRYIDNSNHNIRALLVLAGAAVGTQSRPSSSPADYVEPQNADQGTLYEQRVARRSIFAALPGAPFNDRVILVDWASANPPVPAAGGPQVVSLSPLRIFVLR